MLIKKDITITQLKTAITVMQAIIAITDMKVKTVMEVKTAITAVQVEELLQLKK